jgi:hypothetical protein
MDRKMVPLYRDKREMELWKRAESVVREEYDAEQAREGTVLAQICSAYTGAEGPLEGENNE